MKKPNYPALELVSCTFIFGISAIFVLYIDLHPVAIAFYRLFLGGLLFGAILFFRHQPFAISKRGLLFASLAGLMFGVDLALWNQSIVLIGPGVATILNSLQVFFMAGFGIVFFRDLPTARRWFSLLISFLGVILLCSPEINQTTDGTKGVMVGIGSAVAFALSMLAMRETAKYQKHSLFNTMFYCSFSGALVLGGWIAVADYSLVTGDALSWGLILIYGLVVHVLAWVLMARSMPLLRVAIVGLIFCLEPVVAMSVDLFFLGKDLTIWQFVGATLTISAIYLGQNKKEKPSNKQNKQKNLKANQDNS